MAKAISDEELQLRKRARRRLVGAIALVLLVVVFLPMLLDSEPKPLNQDIAITIPPVPNPESASRPPASSAPPPPAPQAGPAPVSAATQPEAPAAAPVVEAPKPEPKHEAKSAAVPQARTGGEVFVVQLGAFSNAGNAKALQRKLQENKFKAYTETIRSAAGERTRVRAGPYPSREAAEKARERMRAMKLIIGDASVVRQGD